MRWIGEEIRGGEVLYDIGAYVGAFSVMAAVGRGATGLLTFADRSLEPGQSRHAPGEAFDAAAPPTAPYAQPMCAIALDRARRTASAERRGRGAAGFTLRMRHDRPEKRDAPVYAVWAVRPD